MTSITDDFINQIESYGFKVGIISINHLEEIKSDMDATKKKYNDVDTYIGKYLNGFDYMSGKQK